MATTLLPHWSRSFSNSTLSNKEKNVIKSAPGWNPDLATESEADVKADRDPLPKNIKELQKETIEVIIENQGGNKVKQAAERISEKFEKFEDKLEKNIEEKGEKAVERLARRAEAAGTTLGTATGTIKGRAEHVEETVVDEVKSGAHKVSSFVKGSLDSVKKTVGLGGPKQKVKNVDDKVDSDRGA
ncbi:hypothetical protein BGX34_009666 [Mortierella sp. NVP85]|nr:hypothetical protein BGX34_009666 [Mortierella sp. NVP85]